MPAKTIDKDKLGASYLPMRTRLLARRKLEESRLAQTREAIRSIDREIMALDRERMRLQRERADAAKAGTRAAKRFASTATR